MIVYVGITAVVLLILIIVLIAIHRKREAKRILNREQMNHKIQEDTLDRALSNRLHKEEISQSHIPFEVHYSGAVAVSKEVKMLRLTEQAETVVKEYLIQDGECVFLGEEHGRAAVLRKNASNTVCCEIFFHRGSAYVRGCYNSCGQLIRGKRQIGLRKDGIKIVTNDVIETRYGTFLLEFI